MGNQHGRIVGGLQVNFTINSQAFAQELRLVNKIVAAKPVLPILTNVLLRAEEQELKFYATDLNVGLETTCSATVLEAGVVTLPAKKLLDLVEQLPDSDVKITARGSQVTLTSGTFASRLQAMSAGDFPSPPAVQGETVALNAAMFCAMIAKVKHAISTKPTKQIIDGVLFILTETTTALVATDGRRLALTTMARAEGNAVKTIIPSKTLDVLATEFTSGSIVFSQSDHHLFFVNNERVLVSRMLEGKFPQYERIIPKTHDKKATITRSSLMATLKRVGLMADQNQAVFCSFAPQSLVLTASSNEVGDAHEQLAISYDGPQLKVCVNYTYLLDFLQAASNPSMTVEFKDATSPLLLTDGHDYINVLMLLRS